MFFIIKIAEELTTVHERCRGWICPRNEICEAEIEESCNEFGCKVFRTCIDESANTNNNSKQSNENIHLQNSSNTLIPLRTKLLQISKDNMTNTKYTDETTKKIFNDINPTLSSLTMLINYIQNETGIEVIKNWVQKAEEDNDFTVILIIILSYE